MATLKDVRTGFKTILEANITNPGVMVYKRVPGAPIVPCVIVAPANADYLITMNRGGDMWEIDLHVLTPSGDDDVGQDLLDEYVAPTGARSIPAIIHQNKTLGLSGVEAVVARMTAYGFRFETVGTPHIGATLRTRVLITN